MTPKPTKKAYSYVRFSTPEQSKGDSLRRQTDLAQKYADQHGLTLDTELTLRDMGISAFRGANVETGALGLTDEAQQALNEADLELHKLGFGHLSPRAVRRKLPCGLLPQRLQDRLRLLLGLRLVQDAMDDSNSAVYAATEHALNLPSIGSGSKWQNDTLWGRVFMRFKSFNNAAHESTFLASLQNREVSRVVTGTLNYAAWGFISLYTYDTITGRNNDMDKYFGDGDAMQKTAWKVLTRTGFMASAQDAFVNASKGAGMVLGDTWRDIFPKGLEDEIFPKYEDVHPLEKLAGPTAGYISKLYQASQGLLDGEVSEKDAGNIRSVVPGQNIGWLRRGIDYVEEFLGGRDVDRFADQ